MATLPPCHKCGGYLVLHELVEGTLVKRAACCVNCGRVVDATILTFQHLQKIGDTVERNEKYHRGLRGPRQKAYDAKKTTAH